MATYFSLADEATLLPTAALFSPKYGYFTAFDLPRRLSFGADHFTAVVTGSRSKKLNDISLGSGMAETPITSAWSAIGEACERYFGMDRGQIPVILNRSHRELSLVTSAILHPSKFNFFCEQQRQPSKHEDLAAPHFDVDTPLDWVESLRLIDGKRMWIPAMFAFLSYGKGRDIFSSNGLACGQNITRAATSALLEVFERDAFMTSWWAKIPFRTLDLQKCLAEPIEPFATTLRTFGPWLQNIDAGLVRTDHNVPVVAVRARGTKPDGKRGVVFAAASHPDVALALKKALLELSACTNAFRRRNFPPLEGDLNWDEAILEFEDGIRFYLNERNALETDFLFPPGEKIDSLGPFRSGVSNPQEEDEIFAWLTEECVGIGASPYLVDLTTSQLRESGLSVVRAFVPEMVHVNAQHRYRPWGIERLFTLKQKLGLSSDRLQVHNLNPLPHPFP